MLLLFIFTLLFGEIISVQIFVCENSTTTITCPALTSIHVDSANFGRTSITQCPKNRYDQNVNCISKNSTDVMRSICEGQQSCNISASNIIFGDPCPGVFKYLEANYTCENNPTTTSTSAPTTTTTSTAAPTTTSTTTSAPTTTSTTTSAPTTTSTTTSAPTTTSTTTSAPTTTSTTSAPTTTSTSTSAPTTTSTSTSAPTTTSSTSWWSSSEPDDGDWDNGDWDNGDWDNGDSGEPIDGTHEHITCYDNHFEISCPSRSVIKILSANLGRTSSSVCPMAGNDSNTNCGLDETKKIKKRCNGYQICGLSVDAHRFAVDPCYLTYKYLTVTYQCVFKKKNKKIEINEQVTCGGDTMDIECPHGTSLKISTADLGRHSQSLCPKAGYDQNTKCSNNVKSTIKKRCEKSNSCAIPVDQDLLSTKDKCRGTYKYLTVDYKCELH